MPSCDECGSDAHHVWRHRVFESETRRSVQWVCRSCHPELRVEAAVEYDPIRTESTAGADGSEETTETTEIRSDGGRRAGVVSVSSATGPTAGTRCPVCLGETVSDGDVYDCVDCGWTGPLRERSPGGR